MKTLILLLACIALVAAQQGEKGQKGEPGQAGTPGSPGLPGVCSGSCIGGGVRKIWKKKKKNLSWLLPMLDELAIQHLL